MTGSIDNWTLTSQLGDPGEDVTGLVGYTNSSELEKQKAKDPDVGHYIVKDDDLDDLDGGVTISFAIADADGCEQP